MQRSSAETSTGGQGLESAFAYLLAAILSFAPANANAEQVLPDPSSSPTEAELKLLPKYCPDTDWINTASHETPAKSRWVPLLGETFWALHHYCAGILDFNRSQSLGYEPAMRRHLQGAAIREFEYVVRHMPEGYVLAPEIYTYMGRAHLGLGEPSAADAAFRRARKAKPDYWPAYSWWASYLVSKGEKEKAREIAAEGLTHAPNSRTLQLILRDTDSQKRGASKGASQ